MLLTQLSPAGFCEERDALKLRRHHRNAGFTLDVTAVESAAIFIVACVLSDG
jgi:hypothetical protein